jgi:PqqD family protein of HPr-rel-A system
VADRRFRAAPAATLRIVPLDEFTLIYHRASGITHLLAAPAPEILASLADEALDRAELLDRLAQHFDLRDASTTALAARLDELVAVGLVTVE